MLFFTDPPLGLPKIYDDPRKELPDSRVFSYVLGPGGLWILSPEGKHLGTLKGPEHLHNPAWGNDNDKTLYLTAHTSVYRIRLNIPDVRPISAIK